MGNLDLLKQLERSTKFNNFRLHLASIHKETIYRKDNLGNKKKPMFIIDWPRSQYVYMKPMVRKVIKSKNLDELNVKSVNYYEISDVICNDIINDENQLDTDRFNVIRDYFAIKSIFEVINVTSEFVIEINYVKSKTDMNLLEDKLTAEMIQNIQNSEDILIAFTGSGFWTKLPSFLLPLLSEFCPSIKGSEYKRKEMEERSESTANRYYILNEDLNRLLDILNTTYNNLKQFVDDK